MSDLNEFAEIVRKANVSKAAQKKKQKKESFEKNAPLLAELFKSVSDAKKPKEQVQSSENLTLNVEEQVPETTSAQTGAIQEQASLEKKFSKMFNRLQNDFQMLKKTIASDRAAMQSTISSMIMGSSGGGSVRILDNDDVEFKKISDVTENCILVFDATKKKFVVKDLMEFIQGIQVGVEMQYNKSIDAVDVFTYIGEAVPGSLPSSPVWRIKRIEDLGSGDINILWAEGTADFIHTWSDRLTYTYS